MHSENDANIGDTTVESATIAPSGPASIESKAQRLDTETALDFANSDLDAADLAHPNADPPAFGASEHVPESTIESDPSQGTASAAEEQGLEAALSSEPSEASPEPLGRDAATGSSERPASVSDADNAPGSEDADDGAAGARGEREQPRVIQSRENSAGEAAAMPPATEDLRRVTPDTLAAAGQSSEASVADSPSFIDTMALIPRVYDEQPISEKMFSLSVGGGPAVVDTAAAEIPAWDSTVPAQDPQPKHSYPETLKSKTTVKTVLADAAEPVVSSAGGSGAAAAEGNPPRSPDATLRRKAPSTAANPGPSSDLPAESASSHASAQSSATEASSPVDLEFEWKAEGLSPNAGQALRSADAAGGSSESQAAPAAAAVPAVGLPPGHPLLARAQAALRAQLLATKARLEAELAEKSKALKVTRSS